MNRGSEKPTARPRTLPRDRWLTALLDPAVALHFETYGYGPLWPSWGFIERRVPEQLVYSVVGRELTARLWTGRTVRDWRLPAGGFVLLPPNTRHTFAHADRHRPVALHYFRLALQRSDTTLRLGGAPVVLHAGATLREHLERLHDDRQSGGVDATARLKASLALLFSSAFRLDEAQPTAAPMLSYAQRRDLYDLVRRQRGARLRPADLARRLNLSADHFTRLFRRTFGVPPRRWLVEQRIRDATTLLVDSTLNVSQIADELGYPDVYQFSRQFSAVMGMSPRAYRQRRHGESEPVEKNEMK
ncbi:MAG: helix-turn-helix domain-containing protein [Phycisphaeraceae bacterium]